MNADKISVRYECNKCGREVRANDVTDENSLVCSCGERGQFLPDAIRDHKICRCPLCGTDELYLQKDFPERVGLALVVIAFIVATIFWYNYSWVGAIGTLVSVTLVDFAFFHTRKDVTVCYRCLAQFRKMTNHPDHRA